MTDIDFKELEKNFNEKKKKLLKKIEPLVGADAAVALIFLHGYGEASYTEIEVVAQLISGFAPFSVIELTYSPKKVVLQATDSSGHVVRVFPQYQVEQPVGEDGKRNSPWSIDLVVKLYRYIFGGLTFIGGLGYEYDGHSSHFLETSIKKSYNRDFNILDKEGLGLVRISPGSWKKSSNSYKRSLHKYFDRAKKQTDEIQSRFAARNSLIPPLFVDEDLYDPMVTCRVCNGKSKIGPDECLLCLGMGAIKKTKSDKVIMSQYDELPCPCDRQTSCRFCSGTGVALREALLNWK